MYLKTIIHYNHNLKILPIKIQCHLYQSLNLLGTWSRIHEHTPIPLKTKCQPKRDTNTPTSSRDEGSLGTESSLLSDLPHFACIYTTLTQSIFQFKNNYKTTTRRPKVPCIQTNSTILATRCENQIEKMLIREGTRPLQSGQKMTPFWAKIDVVIFGNIFRKNLAPKPDRFYGQKLRGIFFDSC